MSIRTTAMWSGLDRVMNNDWNLPPSLIPCHSTLGCWLASMLICVALSSNVEAHPTGSSPSRQPNILLILADDMGYGDLGCMGSQYLSTPRLDELAEGGVLCRQAYVASSVCSPSRAGLLTGRDPRRFGYEGNLNQSAAKYATRPDLLGLPPGEHTLGDHLKAAGYQTALIGKWHQGTGAGFHPQVRGFDYFCGMLGGGHTYFPKTENNKLERNGVPLRQFSSPYLTDFFTDEALRWCSSVEQDDKPWFLYLSYNAPHTPMEATQEDLEQFTHIQDPKRRTYAAMMLALDRGVGRVMDYLKQSDQLENTLVVFFSDNGGATSNASWNGPLSGTKGCLKEGGIRIPMIWSWPSVLPENRQHVGVVSSLDLLPTFLAVANSEPLPLTDPKPHEDARNRKRSVRQYGAYDGIDILPELSGQQPATSRTLFWRLQGQAAILSGTDKLIRPSHRPAQLFEPAVDLAEEHDQASQKLDRFKQLFRQLAQWEANLATVPLWGSSPFWNSESAKEYDEWQPRREPK